MKKVGKTTRPFRYDLNQIPYDYTVEVTNKFKGLDLIDRMPEELLTDVRDIVMSQISVRSSSGTLSIRSNPLNLFSLPLYDCKGFDLCHT